MRTAILTSVPSTDQGTFGQLVLDDGATFCTGELPWKRNQHSVSCIPEGTYLCKWVLSPRHGECYMLMDVPNRQAIEIHSANFMGDVSKGYLSQLLGCIALGSSLGILNGQHAVLESKVAIARFEANLRQQDFQLIVKRGNA